MVKIINDHTKFQILLNNLIQIYNQVTGIYNTKNLNKDNISKQIATREIKIYFTCECSLSKCDYCQRGRHSFAN